VYFDFNDIEQKLVDAVHSAANDLSIDAYIVGGYVRDRIINRPTKDIDIVTIGDGIALAEVTAKILGTRPPVIFKRYGTAMINFLGLDVEFVGARKESYSSDSRKPSVTPGSLEDDQNRRDFSINAMAFHIGGDENRAFLDPFDGLKDLENRVIRTPGDPDITFSDDPLRMMRAVRFATQLDFVIDDETFAGIKRNVDRIKIISQERITDELNKIILSPVPSIGWRLLLDTGLCELIFPEFYALLGVDYVDGRGHKDNYYHTIEVLDNVAEVSSDLWLRWAAVMHDIGKPTTKRYDPRAGWTFHGHEAVGANMTPTIFRNLRLPLDDKMKYVQKLVRLHLRPISLTKKSITDSAVRRLIFDAGDEIDDLMMLCQADITTKNASKMKQYLSNYELVKSKMADVEEGDRLRNWQPPISGEDIMKTFGISPSRQVGEIKKAIREAILDGDIPNEPIRAREFMIDFAKSLGLSPAID